MDKPDTYIRATQEWGGGVMGDYGAEYFRGVGFSARSVNEHPWGKATGSSALGVEEAVLKGCSKHKTNDTALLQMWPQQCR